MGCICPATDEITARINQDIRQEQSRDRRIIKLLFLGAGGSGKSTLFKQLRYIYGDGLKEEQRKRYTQCVYNNIVFGIKTLLEGNLELAEDDEVELKGRDQRVPIKPCDEQTKNLILEISEEVALSPQTVEVIKKAWADPGLQMTWERRTLFQLQESLEYFVQNIDRIAKPNYVPSKDDVLNVRAVTTGIVEEDMTIENRVFHIVDVGGQRSERRKWIQCFDDVTGIIFVVSLIAYNQTLYEDETTNRMKESLALFKKTLGGKKGENFKDACVVLFLNKDDLFKKLIKNHPITECFPEYKGKLTEDDQFKYIKEKYSAEVAPRSIFVHRTWATNTKQIEQIFNVVNFAIIRKSIAQAGLIMP